MMAGATSESKGDVELHNSVLRVGCKNCAHGCKACTLTCLQLGENSAALFAAWTVCAKDVAVCGIHSVVSSSTTKKPSTSHASCTGVASFALGAQQEP